MFEVNGFTGMKRDIILRLCRLVWHESEKIKAIFGMCEQHQKWKNHSFFKSNRPKNVAMTFRPNPGTFVRTETSTGPKFSLTKGEWSSIFLNVPLTKGVWRWTVQILFGDERDTQLRIGVASSKSLSMLDGKYVGGYFSESSSSLIIWNMYGWSLRGVKSYVPDIGTPIPANSSVSIEADAEARTVCFFVGDTKLPRAVSDVPLPAYFGMLMNCKAHSFTSLSFRKLPSSTPSPIRPIFYQCEAADH